MGIDLIESDVGFLESNARENDDDDDLIRHNETNLA